MTNQTQSSQPGERSRIFGNSTVMEDESLLFYKDNAGGSAVSHLLFPATHIRQMTNTGGDVVYEEGKDFTLSGDRREVTLTPTSKIPFFTPADMYLEPHDPNGISCRRGDPNIWLLLGRETNPFLHTQCLITYEHDPLLWTAYLPQFAGDTLPRTLANLTNQEPLTIGVTGDSISVGYHSTASRNLPPSRPGFFPQVAAGLKAYYGGEVILKNHAVGGWSAANGLKDLPNLLEGKPDLVFIAYGMNDVGRNDAPGYGMNVKALIDQIHQALPETEMIMLSSSIGNAEWSETPTERFPLYRDQLRSFTGPGCALVDITAVWQELLKYKSYGDITGNGVNHPNDFGHRIYAEMILRLLIPTS